MKGSKKSPGAFLTRRRFSRPFLPLFPLVAAAASELFHRHKSNKFCLSARPGSLRLALCKRGLCAVTAETRAGKSSPASPRSAPGGVPRGSRRGGPSPTAGERGQRRAQPRCPAGAAPPQPPAPGCPEAAAVSVVLVCVRPSAAAARALSTAPAFPKPRIRKCVCPLWDGGDEQWPRYHHTVTTRPRAQPGPSQPSRNTAASAGTGLGPAPAAAASRRTGRAAAPASSAGAQSRD